MITQLPLPIPLTTPKGKAWAVAIIDYGPQWDLQWVTFIHATGECWTWLNRDVRQEDNMTFHLPKPTPIHHHAPANGNAVNGSNGHNGHDYAELTTMRPPLNGQKRAN